MSTYAHGPVLAHFAHQVFNVHSAVLRDQKQEIVKWRTSSTNKSNSSQTVWSEFFGLATKKNEAKVMWTVSSKNKDGYGCLE